ncbi:acyl-CoA synthetase family member 2, mitochondrial-like [Mizuhopecten yessoensis]|uniref:Medium-chain acyl-CoA ligase ACSF2, mitochondrial n=1 Tax=Mizuhopecten yessoensis TaxID=6573 RepID=A0A210QUL9_MIZYE|nr:acyl-CoA synthetase family member 2, mitochondrial-like [Mizuhopecten yessoensis]OWF52435.1 Acyl-CoA synthetase family member 2, mitochondrial [Mizuhopecten yessoensis]
MASQLVRRSRCKQTLKSLLSFRRFYNSRQEGRTTSKLKWSYIHGQSDVSPIGITIGNLLQERVQMTPDKEVVVFCSRKIRKTYAQFITEVDKLAAGLVSLGLEKGDRVGIWGPNSYEWILTQYATARAGLILVNVNPQYKEQELEFALGKVGCKAIIISEKFKDQNYYDILYNVVPELSGSISGDIRSDRLPSLKILITMGDNSYSGAFQFSEVLDSATDAGCRGIMDIQRKLQFDDPINIQFTSGTTGVPKGATLSHHNIVNNSHFLGRRLGYHTEESIICVPVPLYHCFGMVMASLCTVTHGAKCVYPGPGFDAGASLKAVAEEKCTSLYGVPTMFIDMLNHPDFDKFDLTSLSTGVMAGSPCPVEVMRQVNERMHMPKVTVAYGTTENSPVTFQTMRDDNLEKRTSTVGRPLDHVEAKVVDEDGHMVPIGTRGELCIRGINTMLEYWDEPEKTAEVISTSRWYSTGDTAVIDEDGFCKIVGRIKDLIIRGGENVYPLEIEEVLYKHPKVKDVQVVGVPDKRLGEEICAWIQVKEGQTLTEQQVKDLCKDKLARYKVPRYVSFVDGYPLTVTGKVQKYKIREAATKDLGLENVFS